MRQELDDKQPLPQTQRKFLLKEMAERLHLSEKDIDEGADGCRMQLKLPVCFDGKRWRLSNDFQRDCGVSKAAAANWAARKKAGKEALAKRDNLKRLECGKFV